jgi:hypothetical protein
MWSTNWEPFRSLIEHEFFVEQRHPCEWSQANEEETKSEHEQSSVGKLILPAQVER